MKNKNIDLPQPQFAPDNILEETVRLVGDETLMTSGSYTGQKVTSTYSIKVTKGGLWGEAEITITCQWGKDHLLTETIIPQSGVPFLIGTVGISGLLTDGGDGQLTLNDEWKVTGTGLTNILPIWFKTENKAVSGEVLVTYYYPKHILLPNKSGTTIGVILLNDAEALEFNKNPDLDYYAVTPITPNDVFNDTWSTLPLSNYIAVQWVDTLVPPTNNLRIHFLGYIQSKQEVLRG